jgi:hypothetical protein
VAALVARHDALRLRFRPGPQGSWEQKCADPRAAVGDPFVWAVDLAGLPSEERTAEIEAHAARAHTSLDASDGPLLRLVLFDGRGDQSCLLFVVHHLAVDWVSWPILLRDLEAAYRQRPFPVPTTSFSRWAQRHAEQAMSSQVAADLEAWLALPPHPRAVPADCASPGTVADERRVCESLDGDETTRLEAALAPRGQRLHVALVAAVALALRRWTGRQRLVVDLEAHGRDHRLADDLDLTGTVGWFTTIVPVPVDLGRTDDPATALDIVEGSLGALPNPSSWGTLRYGHPDADVRRRLAALSPGDVLVNYLGRTDGLVEPSELFGSATPPPGPLCDPGAPRSHVVDVEAWLEGGRLHIEVAYPQGLRARGFGRAFLGDVLEALRHMSRRRAAPARNVEHGEVEEVIAELLRARGSTR